MKKQIIRFKSKENGRIKDNAVFTKIDFILKVAQIKKNRGKVFIDTVEVSDTITIGNTHIVRKAA